MLAAVLFTTGCVAPVEVVEVTVPTAGTSATPHLARMADGSPVLSWVETSGDHAMLKYARLDGGRWTPPVMVASGNNWFLNWADFPSVSPITERLWAAHWPKKKPGGTYSYDVNLSLSNDGGRTWSAALIPHQDDTATEHGFVSLFPWGNAAGAIWLDGRNMSSDTQHGAGHGAGAMTLRAARIGADGTILARTLLDEQVCDCCQTDVAIAAAGPVAVYRDRTAGEVRDVYTSRITAAGWSRGAAVHKDGWVIAGCPVNGPAIAASGNTVVAAWFTAAGDQPRVLFSRSNDGGQSFGPAIDIDAGRVVGRVDVELLAAGAVVSWLRYAGDAGELVVRHIGPGGRRGPVQRIATTTTARSSGFPQMMRAGNQLVFAWTDTGGETTRVRSATLSLEAFNY